MDTSKKYIEMCGEAKEIQKMWKWNSHDYKANPDYENYSSGEILPYIWLPRQDQLQDMMPFYFHGTLNQEFFAFVFHLASTEWEDLMVYYQQFKSWEQLWLAFVMKEKYNKTWDGEKWIKKG